MFKPSAPGARLSALATTATVAAVTISLTAPAHASTPITITPVTSAPAYVLPSVGSVTVTPLLTTGAESVGGYHLAGVPDALSLRKVGTGYQLLVNHELLTTQGIPRANGIKGSFVSKWSISSDGTIASGSDLIRGMQYWTPTGYSNVPPAGDSVELARLCSGSLADVGSLYHRATRTGTRTPIYFANEETGDGGRAFAVNADGGAAVELPLLGRASFEQHTVARGTGRATVVIGNEDGANNASQLWVTVGSKKNRGSTLRRAGLTSGTLNVVKIVTSTGARIASDDAFRSTIGKGVAARFAIVPVDHTLTGPEQNAVALAAGTGLSRIEDGAFDPRNPNDYYFLTTSGGTANGAALSSGGLWRMRFTNIARPQLGGTITLLTDNTTLPRTGPAMNMPDNLAIDGLGNILIQEDPGNNDVIARIFAYRISDGVLAEVAKFDAVKFDPIGASFITKDEESSGIIDASAMLGAGHFLFDAQVHSSAGLPAGTGVGTVEELVENGQLLDLRISDWSAVYGS